MDQATQIEPARIDELLHAYRELQVQFDRVLERLRKAEDQRHTVQRRIYDRVRSEYDRELDTIRARMSPLRDEIDRVHEALEAQCRDAASMVQAVEDELSEAEFRRRIGEFEEGAFASLQKSLDARAEEVRSRHASLQETMTAIASMRRPDAPAHADAAPAEVPADADETPAGDAAADDAAVADTIAPASTPVAAEAEPSVPEPPAADEPGTITLDDSVPHRPVLSASRVNPENRPHDEILPGFENPQDWISEMGPEARSGQRPRVSTPAPAPVPAPVSKPSAAAVDELDRVLTPAATTTADYPSLVFVSGPHAGQAIAMLPTTLSIGREHDNNIEIKDPDVARYHARILRERDQYVVEDLNSTTGTWVNGERVQRAVLTHGDVIRLGQTELALDFEWTTDPS